MTAACLVGTFDRTHSANRLLANALARAGLAVESLHEPVWERVRTKTRYYFAGPRLVGHLAAWARAWARLARRWRRRRGAAPLVVVGFGGQLDVFLAARICRPRLGLVFAPLVSLTETLVEDRALVPARGALARLLGQLDRRGLCRADLVLADTAAHAAYLRQLGGARARIAVWHFGVEPEFLAPPSATPRRGRVLFTGRCLPLHGLPTIVRAAARLADRAQVECIGDGPERASARALAARLGVGMRWRDEVPLAALPGELARAAVVLGVFGTGRKAAMVVPNKVYQAAAVGRPLVTRDGPALREVLRPGEHCLVVPPGDPEALADAVRRLLDAPTEARALGEAARAHVAACFGPEATAARLRAVLAGELGLGPARMPEHAAS